MAYPGIYRAKAVSVNGTKLAAFIPQVFADVSVTVENFVGDIPITGQMGWVSFQGGNPEFPVWHGGGGGGEGTVTDVLWVDTKEPTSAAMELWYDTDEEVPLDPRYLPSAGGAMTGHITLPSSDPPGTYSAVHADYMHRRLPTAHFSGNGAAIVTSGTTAATICTLIVPARPVAGSLMVNSHNRVGKSVVTDIFVFTLYMNGAAMAQAQTYSGGAYEWVDMSGTLGIAANTAATVTVTIQRISGTGTGTSVATYTENNISAIYVPT